MFSLRIRAMKANECMLCWRDQTKEIKTVRWPDDLDLSHGYSAVGANSVDFRSMPKAKKQLALITEGMWLVQHRGFPIGSVYAALLEIDECKEALLRDPF